MLWAGGGGGGAKARGRPLASEQHWGTSDPALRFRRCTHLVLSPRYFTHDETRSVYIVDLCVLGSFSDNPRRSPPTSHVVAVKRPLPSLGDV